MNNQNAIENLNILKKLGINKLAIAAMENKLKSENIELDFKNIVNIVVQGEDFINSAPLSVLIKLVE